MKNRKLRILVPVLVCAALTAVYSIVFVFSDDTRAPEIQMDGNVLEVSVNAGEKALLEGIKAVDGKDGDVTDRVIVEKVSRLAEDNTATVTYVAFDLSGNVAKATRTVKYTDYTPPVFGLTNGLVFAGNTSPDVLKFVTATDVVDGDIGSRVKGTLVSETTSLSYAGMHEIEFRVTNSMGDTQYITLPVEIYEAGKYNAHVELSEYLVYIKKGQEFVPESYLENIVVGNNRYTLEYQDAPLWFRTAEEARELGNNRKQEVRTYINRYINPDRNGDPFVSIVNVDMHSDVNTDVPGQYSVTFEVDYEGRYTGYTRMNVVVEE